jgi:hypothetical protein
VKASPEALRAAVQGAAASSHPSQKKHTHATVGQVGEELPDEPPNTDSYAYAQGVPSVVEGPPSALLASLTSQFTDARQTLDGLVQELQIVRENTTRLKDRLQASHNLNAGM